MAKIIDPQETIQFQMVSGAFFLVPLSFRDQVKGSFKAYRSGIDDPMELEDVHGEEILIRWDGVAHVQLPSGCRPQEGEEP